MALLANVIKVAQFTTIAAASDWSGLYKLSLLQVRDPPPVVATGTGRTLPRLPCPCVAQMVLAAGLIAYGQHLNYLVYALLGLDGVSARYHARAALPARCCPTARVLSRPLVHTRRFTTARASASRCRGCTPTPTT
jgi:hypothetical protein